jgi:hypothetical protein
MKRRNVLITLFLLALVFVAFLIRRWNEPKRKEAFDRHPASLMFTTYALCRMNCRHISREEVGEIMEKGIININKSDKYSRPCPIFALQGTTGSGEDLRVIFAQCPAETEVITCYNLKKDFACSCPGDENKKEP